MERNVHDTVKKFSMRNHNLLYLLQTFPLLSEVFVLNEITGFLDLGWNVQIVSLDHSYEKLMHDNVIRYRLLERTMYLENLADSSKRILVVKGMCALLMNRTLSLKNRLRLLHCCYDKSAGKGLTLIWFLSCLPIIKLIQEHHIEHIHCHFAYQNVRLAYILHQMLPISYTFTMHAYDIFVEHPYRDLSNWAACAKKVITISEFNRQYLHTMFDLPLQNIEIVPCSKYFDPLTPVQNYTVAPLRIVSVSRLVEKKGYPYLIKACQILKDRGIVFSCTIHGEGPERETLENLIVTHGLQQDIHLGGALVHHDVIEFIKTGSVFVLPCIRARNNDMDGLPNVLLEAMALEIPTISTDISGIPELIEHGENGVIVPPENPLALAEAILTIHSHPDLAEKIRKNGRKRVLQEFDVQRNVGKLAALFER